MVSLCGLHDFTLVLPAFHYGLTDIPLLFDYDLTWFAIVLPSFYYGIWLVLLCFHHGFNMFYHGFTMLFYSFTMVLPCQLHSFYYGFTMALPCFTMILLWFHLALGSPETIPVQINAKQWKPYPC